MWPFVFLGSGHYVLLISVLQDSLSYCFPNLGASLRPPGHRPLTYYKHKCPIGSADPGHFDLLKFGDIGHSPIPIVGGRIKPTFLSTCKTAKSVVAGLISQKRLQFILSSVFNIRILISQVQKCQHVLLFFKVQDIMSYWFMYFRTVCPIAFMTLVHHYWLLCFSKIGWWAFATDGVHKNFYVRAKVGPIVIFRYWFGTRWSQKKFWVRANWQMIISCNSEPWQCNCKYHHIIHNAFTQ